VRRSARAVNEALLLEALGFIFVALLIWVNEYLDLPHMLLDAPATPWRPVEVAIESGFVLLLGAAVTGVSRLTFRHLAYLESLLILCAECQRVGDEGHWMDFETFVQSRDRTGTTHGMCPDCQAALADFAVEKAPRKPADLAVENALANFASEKKR
jgi:hypothetical protein